MSELRFQHIRILEAVLFAATEPQSADALAQHLPEEGDLDSLLQELRSLYANRGVTLRRIGDGWAFRTAEDLAGSLRIEKTVTRKLTRAAVETLAIVAYHQPVTRAEIEEVRGVGLSRGTLDALLEAGWIRPRGRRQSPGRPVTWGTTAAFLDHFGLSDIGDLPGLSELKAAGLMDSRSALTALSARGDLTEPGEGEDLVDRTDGEEAEPLDARFGEAIETPVEEQ